MFNKSTYLHYLHIEINDLNSEVIKTSRYEKEFSWRIDVFSENKIWFK